MEEITKALHTSDFLVNELRELASKANKENNRALHILAIEMLESAVKINQRLNELET